MRVEAVYDGAEASRAFGNGEVTMAAVAAAAAATIATGRRHDDAPRGTKAPTRRLAAAAQARGMPMAVLGMDNTSARACLTPQEWRGPRPRSRPPTAATGPTSPQTTRSATAISMLGAAVNSKIIPVFSTGRLAQGCPGNHTWNHTCAQQKRQKKKSCVRSPKASAMYTNAPTRAQPFS